MTESVLKKDRYNNAIQAFALPATGSTTTLAVTTSSGATAALSAGMYRFVSDNDCRIVQGATALVTDMILVGGVPEYFHITQGGKVAAITVAGTASLTVTLC